ncbi:MAG: DUF1223 domain-containing protein [Pseudomonadota bacterium]
MRKTVLLLAGLLLGTAHAAQTAAVSCTARSGDSMTALLELYTSEGCSSCPPADAWLATFRTNGLYPGRVVPLALHVDYWNYLGWKDPYSQELFSRRQHHMARLQRANTVYTPQFILNGGEFRSWRNQGEAAVKLVSLAEPRAAIALTLSLEANSMDILAEARAKDSGDRADMFVVLYENNLSTRIRAGENQGRTLQHEFVARRWLGPVPLAKDGTAHFKQRLELDKAWKANDLGVVAFVQDRLNGEVWQALARPSCP